MNVRIGVDSYVEGARMRAIDLWN
ncbi:hypothetical protein TMatcc_009919 [Talaromyces marneffei ATCC 18224]